MVLEENGKNKMDRRNNELWSFSNGERRTITLKIKKKKQTPLIDKVYN